MIQNNSNQIKLNSTDLKNVNKCLKELNMKLLTEIYFYFDVSKSLYAINQNELIPLKPLNNKSIKRKISKIKEKFELMTNLKVNIYDYRFDINHKLIFKITFYFYYDNFL